MEIADPMDPTQSLRIWKSDSDDGVITISPNRISISHYPPYPGWEQFQTIISEAYLAYVDVAQPQAIQRIGLRYINDIEFDRRSVILANYFTYHPNIGDALPERNQNVRMSVDFLYENNRDLARLQLSTIAGSKENSIAARLDIDYFLLLPGTIDLGQTEEWLNRAHDAVNALFEGSITDDARAMFGRRR